MRMLPVESRMSCGSTAGACRHVHDRTPRDAAVRQDDVQVLLPPLLRSGSAMSWGQWAPSSVVLGAFRAIGVASASPGSGAILRQSWRTRGSVAFIIQECC